MARVTVEDCIGKVANRFELVILAAYRANGINSGLPITVERKNDKDPVIALREIGEGTIEIPALRKALIKHFQTNVNLNAVDNDSLTTEIDISNEVDYLSSNNTDIYDDEDLVNMSLTEEDNFGESDVSENNEEEQ